MRLVLVPKRGGCCQHMVASDVVDVLLALLHAGDVILQACQLLARLGGVVPQQIRKLLAVGDKIVKQCRT